jgi:hypothetical protein
MSRNGHGLPGPNSGLDEWREAGWLDDPFQAEHGEPFAERLAGDQ